MNRKIKGCKHYAHKIRMAFMITGLWMFAAFPILAKDCEPTAFKTSKGVKLTLPPLNCLQCADIEAVIAQIDDSQYRKAAPEPPKHKADQKLFEYESMILSMALRDCGQKFKK